MLAASRNRGQLSDYAVADALMNSVCVWRSNGELDNTLENPKTAERGEPTN